LASTDTGFICDDIGKCLRRSADSAQLVSELFEAGAK
jgi:hypothetical protein